MTPQSDNLRGALYMMVSMAGFALNDAAMKHVLADLPLFPAIFWRGCGMTLLLALICWRQGALAWRPDRRDGRLIGIRTVAEIITTLTFLTALANMPIGNATAILQSSPLAVTLAAALILGETVGWRRLTASLIGFVGVIIIIRPGAEAFNIYALLAVAAVFGIVLRDLATHRLGPGVPSILVALITSVVITTTGAVGSLGAFALPSGGQFAWLVLASLFLILGYLFSVMAMRSGDIGFVSPFRYTILIWALLIGILFFAERPDALTLFGSALVIATGLFTFWRERVRATDNLAVRAGK